MVYIKSIIFLIALLICVSCVSVKKYKNLNKQIYLKEKRLKYNIQTLDKLKAENKKLLDSLEILEEGMEK